MYIDPFLAGILVTIGIEWILLTVLAIVIGRKKNDKK